MNYRVYIYILIVAAVTYLIRILPLTLIRKPIKSRFIRSFLYYVPYVTLSVMTFPAIIYATGNLISGVAAFAVGFLVAWLSKNLLLTAVSSAGIVLVIELLGIGGLL